MEQVRRPRSGLVIVASYAAICGAIFLIQFFPVPGIFVMFFLAALWIGVVIHIAMAHLAIASLGGIIARAWIALPVLFYIGGLTAYLVAGIEVRSQAAAIERDNAAATIQLAPPLSFYIKGGPFIDLLKFYRIDRMVLPLGNKADSEATIYYYARGEECDSASKVYSYTTRDQPFALVRDLFPGYKQADKTRQCVLSKNGPRGDVPYRIEGEPLRLETPLLNRFGVRWTVSDANSGVVLSSAREAEFAVIQPIPMFIAGCALNDANPSWDCFAGMMKESTYRGAGYRPDRTRRIFPSLDPDTWEITPLGRALSLQPRTPTD